MTISGDFIPGDYQDQEAASSPSVFGIQFTPPVIGALVAVLGLAAAAYLFMQLVQPVLDANNQLKQQIGEEEAKIQKPEVIQQQFQEAKAKLEQAKLQKKLVTNLFASEQSLTTLLIDLNKRIDNRNINLKADDIKAKLKRFDPDPKYSGIVADPSLVAARPGLVWNPSISGEALNKLYQKTYRVEMEGTFAQTQLFMLDLERLKTLLVVKNLKSELDTTEPVIVNVESGKLVPIKSDPETKEPKLDSSGKPIPNRTRILKTFFILQAFRPLTSEEQARVQSVPAAAGQPPGQQPPPK